MSNDNYTDAEIKEEVRKHIEYISTRVGLSANKNYTQLFSYFVRHLRMTRIPFLRKNKFWIGVLQLGMLRNLPKFQKDMRLVKSDLKTGPTDKEGNDLSQKLIIYKEWIRIYQTISDGVVWRVLNFNRPVLRLLSENDSMGHIDIPYADILKKFVTSSDIVLINDLTRYLRIGDLTRVTKEGKILLYELKKNGKNIIGMSDIFQDARKHGESGIGRQKHRHWVAQMSIIDEAIKVPVISNGKVIDEHRADIINSNIHILHHFKKIKKLIRKSDKSGVVQEELEGGYFVEITAFDVIASKIKSEDTLESNIMIKRKKECFSKRPGWCNDKNVKTIDLSSLDALMSTGTQFPRNLTPHSILPLSSKDCVRLMMGLLEIKVFLNLDFLKEKLEELGWDVKFFEPPAQKKRKVLEGEFMPEPPNEDFLNLSKSNEEGTFRTIIPLTLILQILSSYYKIDFLLKAIDEGFERRRGEKSTAKKVTINFNNENKILI